MTPDQSCGAGVGSYSNLVLQIGDRVTVVGSELAVEKVAETLGNSMKRLNEPNLVTIFVGIVLGIIMGSLPISFPGIPQPVKLGLAGGPLIVAILIAGSVIVINWLLIPRKVLIYY